MERRLSTRCRDRIIKTIEVAHLLLHQAKDKPASSTQGSKNKRYKLRKCASNLRKIGLPIASRKAELERNNAALTFLTQLKFISFYFEITPIKSLRSLALLKPISNPNVQPFIFCRMLIEIEIGCDSAKVAFSPWPWYPILYRNAGVFLANTRISSPRSAATVW